MSNMVVIFSRDLPPGVTPEMAVEMCLPDEDLDDDRLIVIVNTIDDDLPEQQSIAHEPAKAIGYDDRGRDPMTILKSLCAKQGLWVELVDDGIKVVGDDSSRTFTDIDNAIHTLRTRLQLSARKGTT